MVLYRHANHDSIRIGACVSANYPRLSCNMRADISRIPNLPFFYLVYRAWSHYRAIAGGKHVQWLIDNELLYSVPSKTLDDLYALHAPPAEEPDNKERTLLTQKEVQTFSKTLDMPALEVELERAIWQVEQSLKDPSNKGPNKEEAAGTASEKPGSTTPVEEKNKKKDE